MLLTFNGIGALRQQIRPDARIHGIITDGGQAVNIILERAAMSIGVRSPDGPYLRELVGRVDSCARASAAAPNPLGVKGAGEGGIIPVALPYAQLSTKHLRRGARSAGAFRSLRRASSCLSRRLRRRRTVRPDQTTS